MLHSNSYPSLLSIASLQALKQLVLDNEKNIHIKSIV